VLASEALASVAPQNARHEISAANYQVRLLGTEVAGGEAANSGATPKIKSRSLIVGKHGWTRGSYAVVRVKASSRASIRVWWAPGAFTEDFVEVLGFWLPAHVKSWRQLPARAHRTGDCLLEYQLSPDSVT